MLRALTLAVLALTAGVTAAEARPSQQPPRSQSLGVYWDGRLVDGVRLPAEGRTFFTWDPVRRRTPNRDWRRVGSDRLVRLLLRVLDEFAAAHPGAPRIGIGDLSRPGGGDFGPRFGGVGHVSHQNGLDADVYYPRRDRRERAARRVAQVDVELAQDLVDRFVRAGARRVFVGPNVGLRGPGPIVQRLWRHDDHLHVRLPLTPLRRWENAVAGHALALPVGWRARVRAADAGSVASTYRPRNLERLNEQPPRGGARISLFDYGRMKCPRGAARAGKPIELGPLSSFAGHGEGYNVHFCHGGHAFHARVKVGAATGARRREEMVTVLESVRLTARAHATGNVHSHRILGRSYDGRPIRAWRIGNPRSPRRVLVVGCIHGNECAGMSVTQRLVNLARPVALDLWLIQNLNPDGLARNTRGNANGVDLNRDFDVFSQRESRIARDLIRRLEPDVTVWFHQPQAVVRAWGPSRAIARRYARLADAPYRSLPWPPGAATRWQNGLGQLSFVVELPPGELPGARADRHARALLQLLDPRCCVGS